MWAEWREGGGGGRRGRERWREEGDNKEGWREEESSGRIGKE